MKRTPKVLLAFILGILLMISMGATVSRIKTFTDGSILTAADLNTEFSNLVDNLNAIDDANISDDANIDPKKISSTIGGDGLSRNVSTGVLSVGVDNSTVEINADAVRVKDSGITSAKIQDGGVAADDLANNSVTSAKIVDNTIAGGDIATGTITSANIADGTITSDDLAATSVGTSEIIDGSIGNADMGSNSVSTSQLVAGSVTLAKMDSANCVSGSQATGSYGGAGYTTVSSVVLTKQNVNRAVMVLVNYGGDGVTTPGFAFCSTKLTRDGSAISYTAAAPHMDYGVSAGGHTYALDVAQNGGTCVYSFVTITVCEL